MSTFLLILIAWGGLAAAAGILWALIARKRRERDQLLEEFYEARRARLEHEGASRPQEEPYGHVWVAPDDEPPKSA